MSDSSTSSGTDPVPTLLAWNESADEVLEVLTRAVETCELVINRHDIDTHDILEDLERIADEGCEYVVNIRRGLALLGKEPTPKRAKHLMAYTVWAKARLMVEIADAAISHQDFSEWELLPEMSEDPRPLCPIQ